MTVEDGVVWTAAGSDFLIAAGGAILISADGAVLIAVLTATFCLFGFFSARF